MSFHGSDWLGRSNSGRNMTGTWTPDGARLQRHIPVLLLCIWQINSLAERSTALSVLHLRLPER
jgi:hypothetical protein